MFIQNVIDILRTYWSSLLLGIRTTLLVAIVGTVCGYLLGLLVGGLRAVKPDYTTPKPARFVKKFFDILANIYITIFRGTPMMVQALFFYYALLHVFNWTALQAARSLGMSNAQTMISVVLPQAVRNAFPAIGNELIVNIKDSSVLMIISITELMFQAKSIAGTTFHFTETYFIEAMIYLILNLIATVILNAIEKYMNKGSKMTLPMSDTSPESIKLARRKTTEKGALK